MNSSLRVRVFSGVTDKRVRAKRISSNTRNGINKIGDSLENANWLPSLDTFRTFAGQLAQRSNPWTGIVFRAIRAHRRRLSTAGTRLGHLSNSPASRYFLRFTSAPSRKPARPTLPPMPDLLRFSRTPGAILIRQFALLCGCGICS